MYPILEILFRSEYNVIVDLKDYNKLAYHRDLQYKITDGEELTDEDKQYIECMFQRHVIDNLN